MRTSCAWRRFSLPAKKTYTKSVSATVKETKKVNIAKKPERKNDIIYVDEKGKTSKKSATFDFDGYYTGKDSGNKVINKDNNEMWEKDERTKK